MKTKIITGDCIEVMKTLPENSVDAIITDPPYGLEFMGKDWDKFDNPQGNLWRKNKEEDFVRLKNPNSESSRGGYAGMLNNPNKYMAGIPFQTFTYNWSKEALRILKPGGYLLSFGGTRTYHRMVCAIEDAGFEIRDCIEWVYGSGFPKSLNIGKAVDKLQGNERVKIAQGTSGKPESHSVMNMAYEEGSKSIMGGDYDITKGTSKFEGWGTALKPSHEPIVVARKPLSEKTVAENVLKWGTGGINIDESRVGTEERFNSFAGNKDTGFTADDTRTDTAKGLFAGNKEGGNIVQGRFPANLIHDGSEEVRECFPESKSVSGGRSTGRNFGQGDKEGVKDLPRIGHDDSGSASRFFKSCEFTEEDFPAFYYCAKASKGERNEGMDNLEPQQMYKQDNSPQSLEIFGTTDGGREPRKNNHPTVKPVKLMEYLVKLVAPEGSTVLDCFLGSGTTGVACAKLNRNFIGIEKEPDYVKIAEARLKPYLEQEMLK